MSDPMGAFGGGPKFILDLSQTLELMEPTLFKTCITESVFFLTENLQSESSTNMDLKTKKSLHRKSQLCAQCWAASLQQERLLLNRDKTTFNVSINEVFAQIKVHITLLLNVI